MLLFIQHQHHTTHSPSFRLQVECRSKFNKSTAWIMCITSLSLSHNFYFVNHFIILFSSSAFFCQELNKIDLVVWGILLSLLRHTDADSINKHISVWSTTTRKKSGKCKRDETSGRKTIKKYEKKEFDPFMDNKERVKGQEGGGGWWIWTPPENKRLTLLLLCLFPRIFFSTIFNEWNRRAWMETMFPLFFPRLILFRLNGNFPSHFVI